MYQDLKKKKEKLEALKDTLKTEKDDALKEVRRLDTTNQSLLDKQEKIEASGKQDIEKLLGNIHQFVVQTTGDLNLPSEQTDVYQMAMGNIERLFKVTFNEKNEFSKSLEEVKVECNELRTESSDKSIKIAELMQANQDFIKELDTVKSSSENKEEVEKGQVEKYEMEILTLGETISSLENEVHSYKDKLQQNQDTIQNLGAKVFSSRRDIEEAAVEVKLLEEKIEKLKSEKSSLREAYNKLKESYLKLKVNAQSEATRLASSRSESNSEVRVLKVSSIILLLLFLQPFMLLTITLIG